MGLLLQIKMNKQSGFTLVELLLVLSILSMLILLSTPLNISSIKKHQDMQFLETFQFDVLYIQNLSTVKANNTRISIKFDNDSYSILSTVDGKTETFAVRDYPEGWEVDTRSITDISFNSTGSIRQPGNIKMTSQNETYIIVFPLGKGRGYVVEE